MKLIEKITEMVHIKPTVLVITLKISDKNAPIKRQKLSELIKKTRPSYTFVYELGWPKSLFRFFCNIVWKSLNELFGQPSILHDEFMLQLVIQPHRVLSNFPLFRREPWLSPSSIHLLTSSVLYT